MSKFIFHCGFPKTGSTSIQVALAETDINYLGFTPRPTNNKFYNSHELSFFLEQVVRFGTQKSFKNIQSKIKTLLENEVNKHTKPTVLSNENVIGRITPFDLPNDLKIHRAISVLPQSSTIIIGIRHLETLLFSYYKLLISNGYGESIEYFFKELTAMEPAFGIIDSFNIEAIVTCIQEQRPDIEIKFFDITKEDSFVKCFSDLNISISIKAENQSFNLKNSEYHLSLNHSFYPGKRFLDWFEVHRVFPDSDFDDATTYRLSRSRHLHNAAAKLSFMSGNDLKEKFQDLLPEFVLDVSAQNQAYLDKHAS